MLLITMNKQASLLQKLTQVSENIGVAMVTTGPGATNAITGVAGALLIQFH